MVKGHHVCKWHIYVMLCTNVIGVKCFTVATPNDCTTQYQAALNPASLGPQGDQQ